MYSSKSTLKLDHKYSDLNSVSPCYFFHKIVQYKNVKELLDLESKLWSCDLGLHSIQLHYRLV